jgi:serine/threonine protein kinase
VYKAKDRHTNELVAMKKIRMGSEKEGVPITAIREIKLLRDMQHENVIKVKEVVSSKENSYNRGKGSVYIVFEFMDHDLMGLMDTANMSFTVPQIKCFTKQLLAGLHYCHKRNIMHRDIKGSNLLINNAGVLKLGDFGLSRSFNEKDPSYRYTNRVVTLWYRPPELLLGAVVYGPAIDMWGAGCIMGELLTKRPLFPGKNERDQMDKVFELCGTPLEAVWPGVSSLPYYNMVKPETRLPDRLKQHFAKCGLTEQASELLRMMLVMDPAKRASASKALDHEWFWTDPMPCDPGRYAPPPISIAGVMRRPCARPRCPCLARVASQGSRQRA